MCNTGAVVQHVYYIELEVKHGSLSTQCASE